MQGVMQLTSITQGAIPKPAHHLKECDSQAPPVLDVWGFTWPASRSSPHRPDTLPFFCEHAEAMCGQATSQRCDCGERKGFWCETELNRDTGIIFLNAAPGFTIISVDKAMQSATVLIDDNLMNENVWLTFSCFSIWEFYDFLSVI